MTIRASVTQLAEAQKTSRGVSLYSRWVNRPLGRLLAAVAHELGLTPNQVTVASALASVAGIACLVAWPANPVGSVAGALLLVLGFALDSADGQLSRLTGASSAVGEWYDHVVDSGKVVAVHGGVLVALYLGDRVQPPWLVVPLLFQVVAAVMFVGGTLAPLLRPGPAEPPRAPSTTRSLALLPADYGVLCLSFVLLGWPEVFVWVYGLLLVANGLLLLALLTRWSRQLRAADASAPS